MLREFAVIKKQHLQWRLIKDWTINVACPVLREMLQSRPMHALRLSRRLIRFVLFLYVLTLGVAIASPLVNPEAMDLICTSSGYKFINKLDAGGKKTDAGMSHLLDCPMCMATGITPFPALHDVPEPPHVLSYALRSIPAAQLASLTSAPLPARGPPVPI